MSYAIVFSSKTGNTALLAQTLQEQLPQADCCYFGAPDAAALAADTLYVGFWTDKGKADADTLDFLQQLQLLQEIQRVGVRLALVCPETHIQGVCCQRGSVRCAEIAAVCLRQLLLQGLCQQCGVAGFAAEYDGVTHFYLPQSSGKAAGCSCAYVILRQFLCRESLKSWNSIVQCPAKIKG